MAGSESVPLPSAPPCLSHGNCSDLPKTPTPRTVSEALPAAPGGWQGSWPHPTDEKAKSKDTQQLKLMPAGPRLPSDTWSPLFSPRGRGALASGCHLAHPVSHLFWGGSTSLAWLLIASSDLDSRIASACLWSPCLQSNHPTWVPWRLQEHPTQGEPSTIQASGAGVGNGADLTPLRTV